MFSRTFTVKNISNSLTFTVASSYVCTSPLAVSYDYRRTARFRQGIHLSITQVLLFSEGEKNAILSFSFNLLCTFGQLPRCFAGTLLLPLCLFLRSILKIWSVGAAVMRFTWANISERRFLVSNFSVTRNSLREFYTLDWSLHVCALLEN